MNENKVPTKVINITRKFAGRKYSSKKVENNFDPTVRVISISSGKGGVGKTNIVANLGYAIGQLGKKVLIFDADLGLGNLDVLLGIAPRYNLAHVISGEKKIEEIIVKGPGNMMILPASSGVQELTKLTVKQKQIIHNQLKTLLDNVDILFIDTAAGISSNVLYFNVTAQEIIVVASPEPTSITDAYALMKVLSLKHSEKQFKLLVNMAKNADEAYNVFRQLNMVASRFLDISIEYLGHILSDGNLTMGVKKQKVISQIMPDSDAGKCFHRIAKKLCESKYPAWKNKNVGLFAENLFYEKFD